MYRLLKHVKAVRNFTCFQKIFEMLDFIKFLDTGKPFQTIFVFKFIDSPYFSFSQRKSFGKKKIRHEK